MLLVLEGRPTVRHPGGEDELNRGDLVYPDSDKIGVYTGEERDTVMVRRASNVDYWDGE